MKEFQFIGPVPTLLAICGFHIRATKPPWLSDEYDCLVSVRHADEQPGTVLLLPMNLEDDEGFDFLWGQLLKSCEPMMPMLNGFYMTGFGMVCHDEPMVEHIRIAKEAAITRGHFDRAADLRDLERALQRDQRYTS